jgi:hypothetical protein
MALDNRGRSPASAGLPLPPEAGLDDIPAQLIADFPANKGSAIYFHWFSSTHDVPFVSCHHIAVRIPLNSAMVSFAVSCRRFMQGRAKALSLRSAKPSVS